MHDEWQAQIPFYLTGRLPEHERWAIAAHLEECQVCQALLGEWQLVAEAVREEVGARVQTLPALSIVVQANLRRARRGETLRIAAALIWAQWAVLQSLLPVATLILLLGLLGTIALRDEIEAALPLLALTPVVGALSVAFLHHSETDPTWEIVATTPTSAGTIVFARVTLVLILIVGVMLGGSLAVSLTTGVMMGPLVAVWLGPLLLLSALSTVLAVRWGPALAAGVALTLWVSIVSLLMTELRGGALASVSLRPLLDPSGWLVGSQLVAAALLWWLAWRLAQLQSPLPERGN